MVGVDGGVDAHAGLELADELVVLVEIDPHRDALHHLDEIAGRVLRRQDRELRAGAGRERADRALEHVVGEGVDVERDALADRHIGEIGFLRIGVDPGVGDVDDGEHRGARHHEAAELDLLDLRRDAVHRRAHGGQIEVALGVVERGLGLHVGRKLLERQLGIAEQLIERVGSLLRDQLALRLRGDQGGGAVVEIELRAGLALDQRILALDVLLLERDAGVDDFEGLP